MRMRLVPTRAAHLKHLIKRVMKNLRLLIIGKFIVNFLALAAAYDQTAFPKKPQMMGYCGIAHFHCRRDIAHALLAVA